LTAFGRIHAKNPVKILSVHPGNAPLHNPCVLTHWFYAPKAKRVPHPVYSPNLAPNDFFLFGFIKMKLTEYTISECESLKDAVGTSFTEIGTEILRIMFESWIKHLKWVIKHIGEYFYK
jgi:hypothetical protein